MQAIEGCVEQVVSSAGCKPVVNGCGGSIPPAPTRIKGAR